MFKLEIDTGNAAFDDYPETEVARILRDLADRLESGGPEIKLFDVNGNRVGVARLTGPRRPAWKGSRR